MTTTIRGTDNTAAAPALTGTDTDTGIFFPAADTIAFAEGGAEIARFDSSGNFGIGTSSPAYALEVKRTGSISQIAATSDTTAAYSYARYNSGATNVVTGIISDPTTGYISVETNHPLVLRTNATERARITAAGDFQYNNGYGSVATVYGCRAWVNFNGVGAVSIRASGNVSSITDGGVGIYTVNFSNAMPDVNYATLGTVLFGSIGNKGGIEVDSTGSNPTTTTTRLRTFTSSTTQADCAAVYVSIFR